MTEEPKKKSFSERYQSKNRPPKKAAVRMPKSNERFARLTEPIMEKLLGLNHVCWPLFSILWVEGLRHHGRAFVLPVDALTTIKGLSRVNLYRNLHRLEVCNLISVQRRAPKPPIIQIVK